MNGRAAAYGERAFVPTPFPRLMPPRRQLMNLPPTLYYLQR